MYSRLLKPPSTDSALILGPRGTGKSSWLIKSFPEAPYIDLLEAETYQRLVAAPGRLEGMCPKNYKGHVLIDEIQKIPELLDEVHRLIEKKRLKFILTGSSARKLKKTGVNLLAGRALAMRMFPLTVAELGKDFNLARSLKYGHLPGVVHHAQPEKYLSTYVATYLKEEVMQEGLTRNIGAFSRFLEYASFSQAGLLSVSGVAEDASIERKVVESYFRILEDLLLSIELPIFSRKAKRKLIKKRKFYLFDVGVFRSIRPRGPLDLDSEIEGAALETLVLQELLAINHYHELGYRAHFWRTTLGEEVDFVLYGPKGLVAIEVKRSHKVSIRDLAGLEKFQQDYPVAKCFCIYGGAKVYEEKGITWVPIDSFLMNLLGYLA